MCVLEFPLCLCWRVNAIRNKYYYTHSHTDTAILNNIDTFWLTVLIIFCFSHRLYCLLTIRSLFLFIVVVTAAEFYKWFFACTWSDLAQSNSPFHWHFVVWSKHSDESFSHLLSLLSMILFAWKPWKCDADWIDKSKCKTLNAAIQRILNMIPCWRIAHFNETFSVSVIIFICVWT